MTETQQDEDATKLYRYVASGQLWELRNSSARPTFLNLSSDEPDATCRHWYLQAGTEALHIEVSHSFEADPAKTRFKLVDSEGARVWGLVFSSTAAFEAFHAQWNQCLYENTYQCAFRSESTDKVSILLAITHILAWLPPYPSAQIYLWLSDLVSQGPFSFGVQAADTASAAQVCRLAPVGRASSSYGTMHRHGIKHRNQRSWYRPKQCQNNSGRPWQPWPLCPSRQRRNGTRRCWGCAWAQTPPTCCETASWMSCTTPLTGCR